MQPSSQAQYMAIKLTVTVHGANQLTDVNIDLGSGESRSGTSCSTDCVLAAKMSPFVTLKCGNQAFSTPVHRNGHRDPR